MLDGGHVLAMVPVRIPAGNVDGAVVELAVHGDGVVTAEVRIPAPQVTEMRGTLPVAGLGNDHGDPGWLVPRHHGRPDGDHRGHHLLLHRAVTMAFILGCLIITVTE